MSKGWRRIRSLAWVAITAALFLPVAAQAATQTIPFTPTGSMGTARYGLAAAPLADGRVLVAGGYDGVADVKSAELFNPATGTFSTTGSMSEARDTAVAAPLPGNRVLVAGGRNDRTAEIFDPATGKFTTVAGLMTIAREDAVAAALPDGRVLIAGGYDPVGATTLQTAEIFNPQTNTFSSTGSLMVTKLSGAAAASLGDGRVLIAGGYDGANESKGGMTYDPKTNTFSTVNSTMSKTASLNAAASLPDGEAMVVGGQNPGGDLKTAALFNLSSNTFSESGLGQMPFERKLLAASPVLSTGQVLVAGGYYNGGPTKSALLFGDLRCLHDEDQGEEADRHGRLAGHPDGRRRHCRRRGRQEGEEPAEALYPHGRARPDQAEAQAPQAGRREARAQGQAQASGDHLVQPRCRLHANADGEAEAEAPLGEGLLRPVGDLEAEAVGVRNEASPASAAAGGIVASSWRT